MVVVGVVAEVSDEDGRRSDIALKHDIVLLGHLANGIGFYRFSYNGSDKDYVGVMAQDVQLIEPDAVTRGQDGYPGSSTTRWASTFRLTSSGLPPALMCRPAFLFHTEIFTRL